MANTMEVFSKDPDSILPWQISWVPWLAEEGNDTIEVVEAIPSGTLAVEAATHLNGEVLIWLSGGAVGERNIVTCRVTTVGGRVEDYSFLVVMRDK